MKKVITTTLCSHPTLYNVFIIHGRRRRKQKKNKIKNGTIKVFYCRERHPNLNNNPSSIYLLLLLPFLPAGITSVGVEINGELIN